MFYPRHRSRHPELTDYISFVTRGMQEMIQRGEADALVLLIHASTDSKAAASVAEKFVFEFATTSTVPPVDLDLAPLRAQASLP